MHLMLGASGELPIEDLQGVEAERIFEGLIGAGAVAVEGNGITVDTKLGHGEFLSRENLEAVYDGRVRGKITASAVQWME